MLLGGSLWPNLYTHVVVVNRTAIIIIRLVFYLNNYAQCIGQIICNIHNNIL
jgi:hypothetical protein